MMGRAAAAFLLVLGCAAATVHGSPKSHPPGGNMTVPQLIELQGYPVEVHHVTTEDGYILEIHRIPHGINDTFSRGRPVAFLSHCILCSSGDFIMNTPDKALAYMMADAGYDVWIGNFRGNTYSRKHVTLDPDNDRKFWEFTWDQMGLFDLPAMLDYTLETTGQQDLYYIGFSMGTTTFFSLMSTKPEYNDKIRVCVAMAPVAFTQHMKGVVKWLIPFAGEMDLFFTLFTKGEFLPSRNITDQIVEEKCDDEAITAGICYNIIFLIGGFDPALVNKEFFPLILTNTPAGTSFHSINHYAQLYHDTNFRMYDWGLLGNQKHYGQNHPPVYELSNVTTPVALLWGANDFLATPEDVALLEAQLPNVILNQRVDWDQFNHLDFAWAINADELVYHQVMELLTHY